MRTMSSPLATHSIAALLSQELSDGERDRIFHNLVSQPITSALLVDGVQALQEKMLPVELSSDAIDTCGTGGSGLKTINTSSLTAFIVAAAGGKVAKHGNRSASGNCGCFDLLEELGVRIELNPDLERRIFDRLGITFLFARLHHPALRFVATLRKTYGKKTLFNLLGPLCNPAGVTKQMIGTGSEADAALIAETLQKLGSVGSMVVTGNDGLDEVTITTTTTVRHIFEKQIQTDTFLPQSLCVSLALPSEILGGTAQENAALFLELLEGKGTEAMRNLVLLNAAQALLLTPLTKNISEAFSIAKDTVDSKVAYQLFQSYRDLSHQLS